MAQYPTPQFIEAESKIIFFLTFKQFFLLVGGGAVCLVLYYVLPFFLFAICSVVILLFVAMIAFFKINNTSVVTIFLNFVGFLTGAKNYTWKKKESPHPFKIQKDYEFRSMQGSPALKPQTNKLRDTKKLIELRKK